METINIYDYLQHDTTTINEIIDLDSSSGQDSIFEPELFDDQNEQVLHQYNTATDDVILADQIQSTAVLTHGLRNPMTAQKVEHLDYLPEYPASHSGGYAYVINTCALHPHLIEKALTSFQYSHRVVGSPRETYSTFLRCHVKRYAFQCTGIRRCEYLTSELQDLQHTHATESTFKHMKDISAQLIQSDTSPEARHARSLYRAIRKRFDVGNACAFPKPGCMPVFKRFRPDIAGVCHPFIACIHGPSAENRREHFLLNLSSSALAYDIPLLEGLFQIRRPVLDNELCGVIEQKTSRRPTCGVSHPQGPGKMIAMNCKVTFRVLIPLDLNECPYAIFLSTGTHSHPPPPPSKPPQIILDEILDLIKRMQNLDLTLSTFLRSPQLKDFCQKYNGQELSKIHHSFVNQDRFAAIITKERSLLYPQGRDFNGVRFEYQRNSKYQTYVRRIYTDDDCIMIICGFDQQIQLLASLESFEVDISYKRVEGDINEVIFATLLPDHGKVFTLLRVFLNKETAKSYRLLFREVFSLVSEICERPVQFHYLHDSGIKAIVVDMDAKQMSGLGHYLQSIDPLNRPWTWQLRNLIVFCRVHFMRTISRLLGSERDLSPEELYSSSWFRMKSLLSCQTEEDYYCLIELLQENETQEIAQWAAHKKHPVIAAGLNKACSLMNPDFFKSIRNITNAVEQSHYKSYWMGVYDSLLGATLGSFIIDQRDVDQYNARSNYGVPHVSRNTSLDARYYNDLGRTKIRKRKRLSHSSSQQSNMDDILFQASSSGFIPLRRRGSSQSLRGQASRSPSVISSRPRQSPSHSPSARSSVHPHTPNLQQTAMANHQLQYQTQQREQDLEYERERVRLLERQLELEERLQQVRRQN